jgi:hypothetical protein
VNKVPDQPYADKIPDQVLGPLVASETYLNNAVADAYKIPEFKVISDETLNSIQQRRMQIEIHRDQDEQPDGLAQVTIIGNNKLAVVEIDKDNDGKFEDSFTTEFSKERNIHQTKFFSGPGEDVKFGQTEVSKKPNDRSKTDFFTPVLKGLIDLKDGTVLIEHKQDEPEKMSVQTYNNLNALKLFSGLYE